jgi:hypothetical protein
MRIGFNPHKDRPLKASPYNHQVIIPVYIPNNVGYFSESFQIFKICLTSLFITSHSKTLITIVNNGSCEEVKEYLDTLFMEKKIHEIIHTTAVGKINAVLKGIVGHNFPLVTISDADVLFLSGWQDATYEVFKAFPKAGVVSPVPVFRKQLEYTQPLHFDYFFSKKLKFSRVKNPDAMTLYAKSIGWPRLDEKWKDVIMTVTENSTTAVVGAPHFMATYKSELFEKLPSINSNDYLGNLSEKKFLDESVLNYSAYRLSTYDNFAYHMGNVLEEWMDRELKGLIQNKQSKQNTNLKKLSKTQKGNYFKTKLINALFACSFIKNTYYIYKGLPKGKKI